MATDLELPLAKLAKAAKRRRGRQLGKGSRQGEMAQRHKGTKAQRK